MLKKRKYSSQQQHPLVSEDSQSLISPPFCCTFIKLKYKIGNMTRLNGKTWECMMSVHVFLKVITDTKARTLYRSLRTSVAPYSRSLKYKKYTPLNQPFMCEDNTVVVAVS